MRVFAPLILVYLLMFVGVIALALSSATPWKDPRFGRVAWRIMFYPAILMSVAFAGLGLLSRFIDYGFTWSIFVIVPALLLILAVILKLASVMVGNVRKALQPRQLIEKEA